MKMYDGEWPVMSYMQVILDHPESRGSLREPSVWVVWVLLSTHMWSDSSLSKSEPEIPRVPPPRVNRAYVLISPRRKSIRQRHVLFTISLLTISDVGVPRVAVNPISFSTRHANMALSSLHSLLYRKKHWRYLNSSKGWTHLNRTYWTCSWK